jgi:hypothetical protein
LGIPAAYNIRSISNSYPFTNSDTHTDTFSHTDERHLRYK